MLESSGPIRCIKPKRNSSNIGETFMVLKRRVQGLPENRSSDVCDKSRRMSGDTEGKIPVVQEEECWGRAARFKE